MKIGVVSDSHNQREELVKAFFYFNEAQVDLTVHCGDWVSPTMLEEVSHLRSPLWGVLGNCDTDFIFYENKIKQTKSLKADKIKLKETLNTGIGRDLKLAITHGNKADFLQDLITGQKYDLIFSGHTHLPLIKKIKKTLMINPGSLAGYSGGGFFRTRAKKTIALYDSEKDDCQLIEL